MIRQLLDLAASRTQLADVAGKADETITLRLRDGEVTAAQAAEHVGHNLRVSVDGRIGVAGSTDADAEALLAAAIASAAASDEAPLYLPSAAPLPRVQTFLPRTAAATPADLIELGRRLTSRLTRTGRSVLVHIERSVGSVHVGNSRGVDAAYQASLLAIDVDLFTDSSAGSMRVTAHHAAADLPDEATLDRLVADCEQRLAWGGAIAPAPQATAPVLLLPRAVRTLLGPIEQALVGKAVTLGTSPLSELLGALAFHPAITLVDDPLRAGQPGSRPVDDEGVASFRAPLVEAGRIRRVIFDLQTGALVGRPSTGHGRRTTFGRPQPAFSNLVLESGEEPLDALLAAMGDGLLVDTVADGTGGSSRSGAFTHPVLLGYRVEAGRVTGRVEGVVIAGNVFEALRDVGGVGSDSRWIGSALLPPLLVGGVTVAPR